MQKPLSLHIAYITAKNSLNIFRLSSSI